MKIRVFVQVLDKILISSPKFNKYHLESNSNELEKKFRQCVIIFVYCKDILLKIRN